MTLTAREFSRAVFYSLPRPANAGRFSCPDFWDKSGF